MRGSDQVMPQTVVAVKPLIKENFDPALEGKKVGLVCADSGFYTEELLSQPEEGQHKYVMAVRMYSNVKSAVWKPDEWVSLTKGIERKEMLLSHEENGKPRRYRIER